MGGPKNKIKEPTKIIGGGFTIAISFSRWGGIYLFNGYTKRIVLGWMSITFFPTDLDNILQYDDKTK